MATVSQSPSISEVKAVLAETSNSVGGLCTSSKINKWSKWKPIKSVKKGNINVSDLHDINYGINLPIYSNVASLIDEMVINNRIPRWSYDYPTGGANSPYRLGDFRSYDNKSVAPFGGLSMTNRAAINGGNKNIEGFVLISTGSDTQIGWDDLKLDGRRMGIALKSVLNGNIFTNVADNAGDSSVAINVADKKMPQGNYNGFLFLTNKRGGLTNIVGLDGHPRFGFLAEVVMRYVTVSVFARWNQFEPNKLHIRVSATNTTGENANLLFCALSVRFSSNPCDSTFVEHERSIFTGTKIVPPTTTIGTTIIEETVTINRDENPSWKVCWRNGGAYPNEYAVNILTERD